MFLAIVCRNCQPLMHRLGYLNLNGSYFNGSRRPACHGCLKHVNAYSRHLWWELLNIFYTNCAGLLLKLHSGVTIHEKFRELLVLDEIARSDTWTLPIKARVIYIIRDSLYTSIIHDTFQKPLKTFDFLYLHDSVLVLYSALLFRGLCLTSFWELAIRLLTFDVEGC